MQHSKAFIFSGCQLQLKIVLDEIWKYMKNENRIIKYWGRSRCLGENGFDIELVMFCYSTTDYLLFSDEFISIITPSIFNINVSICFMI